MENVRHWGFSSSDYFWSQFWFVFSFSKLPLNGADFQNFGLYRKIPGPERHIWKGLQTNLLHFEHPPKSAATQAKYQVRQFQYLQYGLNPVQLPSPPHAQNHTNFAEQELDQTFPPHFVLTQHLAPNYYQNFPLRFSNGDYRVFLYSRQGCCGLFLYFRDQGLVNWVFHLVNLHF